MPRKASKPTAAKKSPKKVTPRAKEKAPKLRDPKPEQNPSSITVFNWKMNPDSLKEAERIFESVKDLSQKFRKSQIVVCPPSLYLRALKEAYRGKRVGFGVQDAFAEDRGSWTGEISFLQAANTGAAYTLINHSERKKLGEGKEMARAKLEAALRNNLTPILCVGEVARDASGEYFREVEDEILYFLSNFPEEKLSRIVLAYEPIWAIGKKAHEAATPHDLHEMALYIRKILIERLGRRLAYVLPLLYGGSVDATNADSLIATGEISGFLVGRASLEESGISAILSSLEKSHASIQNTQ